MICLFFVLFSCSTFACSEMERLSFEKISDVAMDEVLVNGYLSFDVSGLGPLCKRWSSQPGNSIVVAPYAYTVRSGKVEETYLAAVIAVIKTSSGRVESLVNDKRIARIDAIYPTSVSVDTAKYRVSSEEVAFGVRFSQKAMSGVIQFEEQFVNLYVRSGADITSIARGIKTSSYNVESNGDCIREGTGVESILSIMNSVTNQKNDIEVTMKRKMISSEMMGGECVGGDSPDRVSRKVIRFNGLNYYVPKVVRSSLSL